MAKSKQTLYLERQVTMLKRELAAAKRDAKSERIGRFKATRREYEKQHEYVVLLENRVLELEQYNLELAMESHTARTAWSRLGDALLRILQTPLSERWYNLRQPVLNWYAERRLSKERRAAMTEAGYDLDPVKHARVARRYWEHDKQERYAPWDQSVKVVYKQGILEEIWNGVTSRYVRNQERIAEALAGYRRRAWKLLPRFEPSECAERFDGEGECEAPHAQDRAGRPGSGAVNARDHGPSSWARESQRVLGDEGRVPEGVRPRDRSTEPGVRAG